jgi:hypothetical protein
VQLCSRLDPPTTILTPEVRHIPVSSSRRSIRNLILSQIFVDSVHGSQRPEPKPQVPKHGKQSKHPVHDNLNGSGESELRKSSIWWEGVKKQEGAPWSSWCTLLSTIIAKSICHHPNLVGPRNYVPECLPHANLLRRTFDLFSIGSSD